MNLTLEEIKEELEKLHKGSSLVDDIILLNINQALTKHAAELKGAINQRINYLESL